MSGQCSWLYGSVFGSPVSSRELKILMGPFPLEVFYDFVNNHIAVGIYSQANDAVFPSQTYTWGTASGLQHCMPP